MRNILGGLIGGSGTGAAAVVVAALVGIGVWVQTGRNASEVVPPQTTIASPPKAVDAPRQELSKVQEPAEPEIQQTVVTPPEPEIQQTAVTLPEQEVQQTAVTPPEPEVQQTAVKPPEPVIPLPTFDEVRREADGLTVIAGKGAPGAQIEVLLDGETVTSTTTDGSGKFAALVLVEPDGNAHVLTLLQSVNGTEQVSDGEIILAPLAPPPVAAPPVATAQASPETEPNPEPKPDPKSELEPTIEAEPKPKLEPKLKPSEQVVITAQATDQEGPAPEALTETIAAPLSEPVEITNAQVVPEPTPPVRATKPSVSPQPSEPMPEPASENVTEETITSAEASAEPVEEPSSAPVAAQVSRDAAKTKQETVAEVAPVQTPITDTAAAVTDNIAPVAVLRTTAAGVELLNTQAPEVMDNVALDTISYSGTGEVQLSGRAQSNTAAVRVYLDNAAIINLPVDAQGRWRGEVPDVDEGIYTLRVDELSVDGKITSRVETPFKREPLSVLTAATAGQDGPIKAITVQKGATLWAIARDRYGRGDLYVRVFEANKQDIRDPDLIYPGQIFDLPD